MTLIENMCACPPLTQWNGRECAKFNGSGGINASSQPGDEPRPQPQKAPPPDCPSDRPVGKLPNFSPQNARFANGQCQCLPGFELRRRVCRPVQPSPPIPGQRSRQGYRRKRRYRRRRTMIRRSTSLCDGLASSRFIRTWLGQCHIVDRTVRATMPCFLGPILASLGFNYARGLTMFGV